MIGSSEGHQFETPFDFEIDNRIPPEEDSASGRPSKATEKARGASKPLGLPQTNPRQFKTPETDFVNPKEPYADNPTNHEQLLRALNIYGGENAELNTKGAIRPDDFMESQGLNFRHQSDLSPGLDYQLEQSNKFPEFQGQEQRAYDPNPDQKINYIDRSHHVPLVASALTDDNGQMYGMAMDHRIPPRPEYEKHLWDHEAFENEYMNHLIKIGYSSQDAYHEAHDWSTQRESKAVEAEFGKEGLEDYKQHWRDAAAIASEPSEYPRHPDAHTTRHGLDESELGQKFAANTGMPKDIGSQEKEEEQEFTRPPEQPLHRNFQPLSISGPPPAGVAEGIRAPAVRHKDTGKVTTGIAHWDAYSKSGEEDPSKLDEGFLTTKGKFVDRIEAAQIANRNRPLRHQGALRHGLTSEDLGDEKAEDLREELRRAFKPNKAITPLKLGTFFDKDDWELWDSLTPENKQKLEDKFSEMRDFATWGKLEQEKRKQEKRN